MNYRKFVLLSFSIACVISIITCLIVDFALNRSITWALYPVLSVPMGWLMFSPLLLKKHGIVLALCSLTIFVLPYLFLLEKIVPFKDWFTPLGIPSAATGMLAIWIIFLVFRFLKINLWYKSAITLFVVGVLANLAIGVYVDIYLYDEFTSISTLISSAGCLLLTIYLIVQGRRKTVQALMQGDIP